MKMMLSQSGSFKCALLWEYVDNPSNWQSVRSLKDYLSLRTSGIEGIDIELTIHIRNNGATFVDHIGRVI